MGSLVAFLFAAVSHWVALMTGVVAIAVGIIQHFRKRPLKPPIFIAVGVVALLVASYQAWDDERRQKETAECRLERVQSAREQRRAFILQNLRPFYAKAQELLHRRISTADLASWSAETDTFQTTMTDWIRTNMGEPAVAKLNDMSGPSYFFSQVEVNEVHGSALNWLNKASGNLTSLMQQSDWDQFAPPIPRDCG
jgi:hypothetical protein